jgi:hypothetical protein
MDKIHGLKMLGKVVILKGALIHQWILLAFHTYNMEPPKDVETYNEAYPTTVISGKFALVDAVSHAKFILTY